MRVLLRLSLDRLGEYGLDALGDRPGNALADRQTVQCQYRRMGDISAAVPVMNTSSATNSSALVMLFSSTW